MSNENTMVMITQQYLTELEAYKEPVVVEFQGNMPQRMTAEAAGMDLISAEDYTIPPRESVYVKTGTKVALPDGYCALLLPRSSIANKRGLMLSNSVGLLDSDYRGELMFSYYNVTETSQFVSKDERIGQMLVLPYVMPVLAEVAEFTNQTERGEGGFGSSGTGLEGKSKAKRFEPLNDRID